MGSQTLFSEDLSPFWKVGFYLSAMLWAARHCFQRICLHSGRWGSISLPCYGQPDTVFRGFVSILEGGVLSLCHVMGSQTLFSEDLSPFWRVGFYLSAMLWAARHCFQRICLHSGGWGSISLPCYGQPDTVFRGFVSILEGGVLSLCHVMGSQTLFSEDLSPFWRVGFYLSAMLWAARHCFQRIYLHAGWWML